MPYPPFSYSALTSFEQCPKAFLETKILKKYSFIETEALTYGKETHKSFENRILNKTPLPAHLQFCESIIAGLEAAGYTLFAEIDIAITRDFKPTGYWSKDAWFRGSIDMLAVKGTELLMFDWKTGKRYVARGHSNPETGQLKLYGLILSVTGVEAIRGAYIWLKEKLNDVVSIDQSNLEAIREEYIERGARFEKALAQPPEDAETWKPLPSPLCSYCPVLDDCPAAAKYKAKKKYIKK
jgi:hypothetical protein